MDTATTYKTQILYKDSWPKKPTHDRIIRDYQQSPRLRKPSLYDTIYMNRAKIQDLAQAPLQDSDIPDNEETPHNHWDYGTMSIAPTQTFVRDADFQ